MKNMKELRRVRGIAAMEAIQKRSVELGLDKISLKEINRIIAQVRKERRSAGDS